MDEGVFIVRCGGTSYGPFLAHETAAFAATLEGESEVLSLVVPRLPTEHQGPWTADLMDRATYQAYLDSFKTDTEHVLAGIIQEFYFARLHERVLTVHEIVEAWTDLFKVAHAVKSLMHYAETVMANPTPENLEALSKAFWRNRDSDDVDLHYAERFW